MNNWWPSTVRCAMCDKHTTRWCDTSTCIYVAGSWRRNPRHMMWLEIVEDQLTVTQWYIVCVNAGLNVVVQLDIRLLPDINTCCVSFSCQSSTRKLDCCLTRKIHAITKIARNTHWWCYLWTLNGPIGFYSLQMICKGRYKWLKLLPYLSYTSIQNTCVYIA